MSEEKERTDGLVLNGPESANKVDSKDIKLIKEDEMLKEKVDKMLNEGDELLKEEKDKMLKKGDVLSKQKEDKMLDINSFVQVVYKSDSTKQLLGVPKSPDCCSNIKLDVTNKVLIKKVCKSNSSESNSKKISFWCQHCGYKTYFKADLKRHITCLHMEDNTFKCTECDFQSEKITALNHSTDKPFNCTSELRNVKSNVKLNLNSVPKSASTSFLKFLNNNNKKKRFSCQHCGYRTKFKANVIRHIACMHMENKPFKSTLCDYQSGRKAGLKDHISHNHSSEKPYDSSFCDSSIVYKQHINFKPTGEKPFACSYCDFETEVIFHLKDHIMDKHSVETPHKCMFCDFSTAFKTNLHSHISSRHKGQREYYSCDYCNHNTVNIEAMKEHVIQMHSSLFSNQKYKNNVLEEDSRLDGSSGVEKPSILNDSKILLEYPSITKSTNVPPEKKFHSCPHCEFVTTLRSSLNRHIACKHTEDKKYKCTHCDYQSERKASLKIHVANTHLMEKPYHCPYCDYKTAYKLQLNSHFVSKHSAEEKPFYCPFCNFTATHKSYLLGHISSKHSKEKLFECALCDFKTAYKGRIKDHLARMHKKKKLLNLRCKYCNFTTSYRNTLSKHVADNHSINLPYKCMLCDYSSERKYNLRKHIACKHSTEDLAVCENQVITMCLQET